MDIVKKVSCKGNTVVMMVTDEVEEVIRAKIHSLLTYLYAELCHRNIYQKFQCEGCESNWSSQKDHECCIKTENEIFYQFFTEIKNEVHLDMLQELCELFFKLADLPLPQESVSYINTLADKPPHVVCATWKQLMEEEEEAITDFIL